MKEIRELVDLVTERGLAGLEIERAGFRLRIDGPRPAGADVVHSSAPHAHASAAASLAASRGTEASAAPETADDENVHVITSPIVGTFYRSPSPESDAFAEIGQRIAKGKILCIIESMKLMNEIESEVSGTVVAKLVENGRPVEYGESLFAVQPS